MKPHFQRALAAAALLLLPASQATAQTAPSPYAGEQQRAIKSLAESDLTALLEGRGAGFAKAAELNGYPGPMHTLELREPLGLTLEQVAASEALMTAHKARARELGAALVWAERRLDILFADRVAQPQAVESTAGEVGVLQARLRAEHLNTHIAQTALLRTEQVQRYNQLRGYAVAPGVQPAHPHKSHH
jgi:hypothetical protein